jgi:capping protein alpha
MSADKALGSFIESAPPGEVQREHPTRAPRNHHTNSTQLADVTKAIKSILENDNVEAKLAPAFQQYNEAQFTTTKLPGGATEVLVSEHNSLGDGRYYDVETQSSFDFDHATGKASAVQSYVLESQHENLVYVPSASTMSKANPNVIARASSNPSPPTPQNTTPAPPTASSPPPPTLPSRSSPSQTNTRPQTTGTAAGARPTSTRHPPPR